MVVDCESAESSVADLKHGAQHAAASVLLWVFIPKGFFPVQDNGIFRALCRHRNPAPLRIWPSGTPGRGRDFAGSGSAKFDLICGVDGTNPSLNSARLQINLKPWMNEMTGCKKSSPVCKRRWKSAGRRSLPATNAGPDY